MSLRFIPTKVHGALDYIVAIALVLAPMIFGFKEVGGAAVAIPMILGAGLFLYSLLTNYEWGIFKVINMRYHLVVDIIAASLLTLSPFIFGFIKEAPNAWLPHIVVGLTVILVVIFSKTAPADQ
ncbi:MAG: hypothetical protein ABWX90_03070 [Candidatus Saccharimonadales bacterium]